jgi:hypothetical protein
MTKREQLNFDPELRRLLTDLRSLRTRPENSLGRLHTAYNALAVPASRDGRVIRNVINSHEQRLAIYVAAIKRLEELGHQTPDEQDVDEKLLEMMYDDDGNPNPDWNLS